MAILFVACLVSGLLSAVHGQAATYAPALPTNLRVWAIPDNFYNPGPPASGFLVSLMEGISNYSGLAYTLTPHPELTLASPQGNFTGSIIGALINNDCDVALGPLTVTAAREAVVDFLLPFTIYNIQLVVNSNFGLNSQTQYLSHDDADLALLLHSNNATLNAIYNNINNNRPGSIITTFNTSVILAKVASGNFAFIGESPFIQNALNLNGAPTNVRIFDSNIGSYYEALAVQLGSPLRKVLDIAIEQFTESGQMRIIKQAAGIPLFQTC